jgi:ABC-2 type transport system ATP-binding protein
LLSPNEELEREMEMELEQRPAVRLSNLSKHFRNVTAVDRLSLDVMPGDVLALIGANGSGKSTTFRLMLNIYRASAGESLLLQVPSSKLNGSDFERVCYISEGQKQPLWMRVEYFLAYCSKMYPNWDQALCDRLVESFGLPMRQTIKHLSRGQKMKLAVASTLPCRPKLLLLDEPFSGLDVETRAQLGKLLKKLSRDDGLATIITTHDVEEVEPVANRIAILHEGRLIVDEALDSFIDRHRRISIDGLLPDNYPADLSGRLIGVDSLDGDHEYMTDKYSEEFGNELESLLPEGIQLSAEKMTLREILTGKAVKL